MPSPLRWRLVVLHNSPKQPRPVSGSADADARGRFPVTVTLGVMYHCRTLARSHTLIGVKARCGAYLGS